MKTIHDAVPCAAAEKGAGTGGSAKGFTRKLSIRIDITPETLVQFQLENDTSYTYFKVNKVIHIPSVTKDPLVAEIIAQDLSGTLTRRADYPGGTIAAEFVDDEAELAIEEALHEAQLVAHMFKGYSDYFNELLSDYTNVIRPALASGDSDVVDQLQDPKEDPVLGFLPSVSPSPFFVTLNFWKQFGEAFWADRLAPLSGKDFKLKYCNSDRVKPMILPISNKGRSDVKDERTKINIILVNYLEWVRLNIRHLPRSVRFTPDEQVDAQMQAYLTEKQAIEEEYEQENQKVKAEKKRLRTELVKYYADQLNDERLKIMVKHDRVSNKAGLDGRFAYLKKVIADEFEAQNYQDPPGYMTTTRVTQHIDEFNTQEIENWSEAENPSLIILKLYDGLVNLFNNMEFLDRVDMALPKSIEIYAYKDANDPYNQYADYCDEKRFQIVIIPSFGDILDSEVDGIEIELIATPILPEGGDV